LLWLADWRRRGWLRGQGRPRSFCAAAPYLAWVRALRAEPRKKALLTPRRADVFAGAPAASDAHRRHVAPATAGGDAARQPVARLLLRETGRGAGRHDATAPVKAVCGPERVVAELGTMPKWFFGQTADRTVDDSVDGRLAAGRPCGFGTRRQQPHQARSFAVPPDTLAVGGLPWALSSRAAAIRLPAVAPGSAPPGDFEARV